MGTDQQKFTTYLPRDEAAALQEAAREDERTITAILRIGVRLYLSSRQNYHYDSATGETHRVPPQG